MSMLINEALKKITKEYLEESKGSTRNNPLHKFIREEIPEIVIDTIGKDKFKDFYAKASGGEGNWRKIPWITILHNSVSLSRDTKNPEGNRPSAKWGYYPVYLFKSDMTEILFGLGQAETNVRKYYPSKDVETILKSRAAILRDKVPEYKEFFKDRITIDLHDKTFSTSQTQEAKRWVLSIAFGKVYKLKKLPSENELRNDLINMFDLFYKSIERKGVAEESFRVDIPNTKKYSKLVDHNDGEVVISTGKISKTDYVIEQRENELVKRYKKYLINNNLGTFKINQISIPQVKGVLETDGWIVESQTLIEAKASSERIYIRMAIGQLLDYKRHHMPKPKNLAILLPNLPNNDLIDLLHSENIDIIYEEGDK